MAGLGLSGSALALLSGCGVFAGPVKIARIGYLSAGASGVTPGYDALRAGLRDLGYIEGQNIGFEPRWAEGGEKGLPELVAELVRLGVDVLVAAGTQVAQLAKEATEKIPIVFVGVGDPLRGKLVSALERPGGNVTGLTLQNRELEAKRLQLLRQALPDVSRVAVLWEPDNAATIQALSAAQDMAPSLGIQLQVLEVRGPNDFEPALAAAVGSAGALLNLSGPLTPADRARLVDLAAKSQLPAMYGRREFVELGGLMAYGPNSIDLYRRAATYVDKILKGAKPADLPIEQPTKFDFVINLKTARALGLTIPQEVLMQATEAIQ